MTDIALIMIGIAGIVLGLAVLAGVRDVLDALGRQGGGRR